MSHVLVTGGFGAIGSWVTRTLVEEGHEVTVLSRSVDHRLVTDVASSVNHHPGSILDLEGLRQAMSASRATYVIHCAAALSATGERDPRSVYETNVIGSLNVFQAAHEAGVQRVVCTSSKGVYGRLDGRHGSPEYLPVSEDLTGTPSRVYGASKKALEGAAEQCRRVWKLDIVALRAGSTFGPGKAGDRTGYAGVKARIVQAALAGEPMTIDNPDVLDDVIYNADVGLAHVRACFAAPSEHWRFNVASGELTSLREWSEEVMRHCPDHQLTFGRSDPAALVAFSQVRLDITRAREELGYQPRFPGVSGVGDYVARERALVPA